jgi:hypothetical protein
MIYILLLSTKRRTEFVRKSEQKKRKMLMKMKVNLMQIIIKKCTNLKKQIAKKYQLNLAMNRQKIFLHSLLMKKHRL